ncbi:hypothetical protein OAO87_00445 [bacterium]|nr:hypothetical protein [bacterium]
MRGPRPSAALAPGAHEIPFGQETDAASRAEREAEHAACSPHGTLCTDPGGHASQTDPSRAPRLGEREQPSHAVQINAPSVHSPRGQVEGVPNRGAEPPKMGMAEMHPRGLPEKLALLQSRTDVT